LNHFYILLHRFQNGVFGNARVEMNPFFSSAIEPRAVLVVALLNRLRAALRLRSPEPATVYDDSAAGFRQPVPRHRRYNCSVHHEPESFLFSGLPFCKGDVDSVEQATL
jgi:hypothetical protein